MVQVGNWVRLREIPPLIRDFPDEHVQEVYRHALGQVFQVDAIEDDGRLNLLVWSPTSPDQPRTRVDILVVDPAYVDPVPAPASPPEHTG